MIISLTFSAAYDASVITGFGGSSDDVTSNKCVGSDSADNTIKYWTRTGQSLAKQNRTLSWYCAMIVPCLIYCIFLLIRTEFYTEVCVKSGFSLLNSTKNGLLYQNLCTAPPILLIIVSNRRISFWIVYA